MAIPLVYNVRNLRVRFGATVMTALGIALTVAIAIFIMMLLAGLNRAFQSTGNPNDVLGMRKGSDSELSSFVSHEIFNVVKTLPGVAKDSEGNPLVSGEMVVAIVLPRADGTGETNVTVRGMTPMGLKLRDNLKLVEGRWFNSGQREITVSRSVERRFGAHMGKALAFGKGQWTVVGIFDASGTAYDSEIWGDVNQMATDFDRTGGYSSAHVRATDEIAAASLARTFNDDQRLKLDGLLEKEYFDKQTNSGAPIKFVGTLVAVIMAIGSCFAAMNTMYAAVAYRGREIATLRVMGFNRPSILTSFVFESLLLSLIGGLAAVILMLPFNGLTTGTSNFATFSEVVFQMRITPSIILSAILFAAFMGLLGGLAPAWHASRQNILNALRD
jgi:putative ABC transport system permease protein